MIVFDPMLIAFFVGWTVLAIVIGIIVGKRLRGSNGTDARDRKGKGRKTA